MPLGFEDLHQRHHGRVCDFAALEKSLVNVADSSFSQGPDDLHDLQFLVGQRCLPGPHTKKLVLRGAGVKRIFLESYFYGWNPVSTYAYTTTIAPMIDASNTLCFSVKRNSRLSPLDAMDVAAAATATLCSEIILPIT